MTATDFERSVLAQTAVIRHIGRTMLRDPNQVDDFTQEVIARVYAERASLRHEERLPQWVRAIARNLARNWNRAGWQYVPTDDLAELPVGDDTPADAVESSEMRRAVNAALKSLPESDEQLFRAFELEDSGYKELSRRFGLTDSAVGVRLHRTRRRLRRLLQGLLATLGFSVSGVRTALGEIALMSTKTTVAATFVAATIVVGSLGYRYRPFTPQPAPMLESTELKSSETSVVPTVSKPSPSHATSPVAPATSEKTIMPKPNLVPTEAGSVERQKVVVAPTGTIMPTNGSPETALKSDNEATSDPTDGESEITQGFGEPMTLTLDGASLGLGGTLVSAGDGRFIIVDANGNVVGDAEVIVETSGDND